MATKDARGTKRTCQNSECGSRFYDLNRSPIECPICGESYALPSGGPVAPLEDDSKKLRKAPVAAAEPAADEDADDALVSLEEADAEIAGDDDETFLEEEEEADGGVTDIVGGVAEGDEEP